MSIMGCVSFGNGRGPCFGPYAGIAKHNSDDQAILDSSLAATASPTVDAPEAATPFQIEGLPEYSMRVILKDTGGSSPRSRAYQWLVQDPLLEDRSISRQLQRFALATLYYSTHGDGWTGGGNPAGGISSSIPASSTSSNLGNSRQPPGGGPPSQPKPVPGYQARESPSVQPPAGSIANSVAPWLDYSVHE